MRQLTAVSIATIVTLLAFAGMEVDGARHQRLSVHDRESHNARRVRAKLQHGANAKRKLKTLRDGISSPESILEKISGLDRHSGAKDEFAEDHSRAMAVQNGHNTTRPKIGVNNTLVPAHCHSASKFRVLEVRFHEQCSRTNFGFFDTHWYSTTRANMAYNKFCSSDCAGAINNLLAYPEGYSCFQGDDLNHLRMFSAMCQFSPDRPTLRCGAEVATSGIFNSRPTTSAKCFVAKSDPNPSAKCWGTQGCFYDGGNKECKDAPSQKSQGKVCTQCFQRILSAVEEDAGQICSMQDGQFCMVEYINFIRVFSIQGWTAMFNQTVVNAMCRRPTMMKCLKAIFANSDNERMMREREKYEDAVEMYGKSTASWAQDAMTKANRALQFAYIDQRNSLMTWDMFCVNNGTTNKMYDTSCVQHFRALPIIGGGYGAYCPIRANSTVAPNACPANCSTHNAQWLNDIGCCAPYMHRLKNQVSSLDFFPVIEGHTPDTTQVGAIVNGVKWNFTAIERCSGGTTAYDFDTVPSTCDAPMVWTKELCVNTTLIYDKWTALPAYKKDRFEWAVRADFTSPTGIPVSRSTVTFTAGAPAGTKICFKGWGPASTVMNAEMRWKNMTSTFVLSRAEELLEHCKDCIPVKETSLFKRPMLATIPGAPKDPCNVPAFFDGYQTLLKECSTTDMDNLFTYTAATLSAANSAWSAACNSKCLGAFKNLTANATYSQCIPSDIKSVGNLINVGCSMDNAKETHCGAVLTVMGSNDCASISEEAQCTTASNCRWNNATNECKDQFTEKFLKPLCDGGCITKLAATVGMNGDSFGKEAKLMDNLFCSHDNGALCLPLIQDTMNRIDEDKGFATQTVENLCNPANRSKLRCMKRVVAAVSADVLDAATEDFYHCVDSIMDDTSVKQYEKAYRVETTCMDGVLAETISYVEQQKSILNNLCSKNANGKLCMSFPNTYGNDACINGMLHANTCPATCVARIDEILNDVGCCTGNLQEIFGYKPVANLGPEDYPEFDSPDDFGEDEYDAAAGQMMNTAPPRVIDMNGPQAGSMGGGRGVGKIDRNGYTGPSSGDSRNDGVNQPNWYFFANYATCLQTSSAATKKPAELVYKKCKKQRGSTVANRTLDLGVGFEVVSASPKKQARFEKKLESDLSIKLGCSSDDFPNKIPLKKNPNKKINVGRNSGPSTRRQTTTSNDATQSDFSIQTEDNTNTEESAKSYDTAVESGTLTLSSTSSLVQNECDNCTASGTDASSVSTSASGNSVTLETEANAAAAGSSSSGSGSGSTGSSSLGGVGNFNSADNNGATTITIAATVLVTILAGLL